MVAMLAVSTRAVAFDPPAAPSVAVDQPSNSQEDARSLAQATAILDRVGPDESALLHAQELLQQVVQSHPENSQAHVELARARLKLGFDPDEYNQANADALRDAESELRLAIKADPVNANAFVLMGMLRVDQGQPEQGLAALRKAESLHSTNPWLELNRAHAFISLDRWQEAEQSLHAEERRIATDPASIPGGVPITLNWSWWKIHSKTHAYAELGRDLDQAIALQPNYWWFYTDRSRYRLGAHSDLAGAEQDAEHAMKLSHGGYAEIMLALINYVKWDQLRESDAKRSEAFLQKAEALSTDRFEMLMFGMEYLGINPSLQHLMLTFHAQGMSWDTVDSQDFPAMVCAVDCARPESVEWLLTHGANPDVAEKDGMNALIMATARHDAASARLLIEHGANVNALQRPYLRSPLYYVARDGDIEVTKLLLAKGADPNLSVEGRTTPLMEAASTGQTAEVALLLDAGANPTIRDKDGDDAAAYADQGGHAELAESIRQRMPHPK